MDVDNFGACIVAAVGAPMSWSRPGSRPPISHCQVVTHGEAGLATSNNGLESLPTPGRPAAPLAIAFLVHPRLLRAEAEPSIGC